MAHVQFKGVHNPEVRWKAVWILGGDDVAGQERYRGVHRGVQRGAPPAPRDPERVQRANISGDHRIGKPGTASSLRRRVARRVDQTCSLGRDFDIDQQDH